MCLSTRTSLTPVYSYILLSTNVLTLGVYITTPLPNEDVDHEFAEPAFFIVNPQRNMHIISITTAPIIRADVKALLLGLAFTMNNDIGPRGLV